MKPKPVKLAAVRPNVGIEAAYRRRLWLLIEAMHADVLREVRSTYAANPPAIAQDRSPAKELQAMMGRLGRRWEARFAKASDELSRYFALSAANRSSANLTAILRRAGLAITFKLTREVNDIVQASVAENVALIKSIPAQFFTQVEGDVMRSVQVGGDLATLTAKLTEQYGVTRRRAAFIARDQNAKATAAIQKARYQELGIEEAIWMHSGGGKHPRPTHLAQNGKRFSVRDGWKDPDVGEFIHPGQLPNCRCVSRPILPFLTDKAA